MYSPLAIGWKYVKYFITASNGHGHGIHSPFVFEFVTKVLNDKSRYGEYGSVEQLRKHLLRDNSPIPIVDFGAKSVEADAPLTRSVKYIASNSAKSRKYAQLLFRMARYYRPDYILELGTSLGISTAYLALGNKDAVVTTAEGNDAVAQRAAANLSALRLQNVNIVTGPFDNTLPEIIGSLPRLDFVFIDGNHRCEPTLQYFDQAVKKCAPLSIIILDDIHWSAEMEQAWESIRSDKRVMLSVDLFFLGLVFFRPEFKVKQHFTIRF